MKLIGLSLTARLYKVVRGYIIGSCSASLVYSPRNRYIPMSGGRPQYIPETQRIEGIYWGRGDEFVCFSEMKQYCLFLAQLSSSN